MRRRLVGDQHRGLLRQRDGDLHALELAAGERRQRPLRERIHAGAGERRVDGGVVGAVEPRERLDVRRAPERHGLAHRDPVRHGRPLWDEGAQPREPAAADRAQLLTAPAHAAARDVLQPGDGAHERRLARPVGPDDGDQAARVERQVGGVQDRRAADPHLDVARLEQRAHQTALRSSQRNSGTPSTTISGPTGSSRGASTMRASVSPASSSAAPASADVGTTKPWLDVPPGEPHDVRDDQAEEAQQPGERGRRRGQQGGRHRRAEPDRPRTRPERGGDVVAQREPVERPDQQRAEHQPGGRVRPHDLELRPALATSSPPARKKIADCTRSG